MPKQALIHLFSLLAANDLNVDLSFGLDLTRLMVPLAQFWRWHKGDRIEGFAGVVCSCVVIGGCVLPPCGAVERRFCNDGGLSAWRCGTTGMGVFARGKGQGFEKWQYGREIPERF